MLRNNIWVMSNKYPVCFDCESTVKACNVVYKTVPVVNVPVLLNMNTLWVFMGLLKKLHHQVIQISGTAFFYFFKLDRRWKMDVNRTISPGWGQKQHKLTLSLRLSQMSLPRLLPAPPRLYQHHHFGFHLSLEWFYKREWLLFSCFWTRCSSD